jgi:hypothetical protein
MLDERTCSICTRIYKLYLHKLCKELHKQKHAQLHIYGSFWYVSSSDHVRYTNRSVRNVCLYLNLLSIWYDEVLLYLFIIMPCKKEQQLTEYWKQRIKDIVSRLYLSALCQSSIIIKWIFWIFLRKICSLHTKEN